MKWVWLARVVGSGLGGLPWPGPASRGLARPPMAWPGLTHSFGLPTVHQGSKVCAKFPDGMIFGENKIPTELSGGAAGRPGAELVFFFGGAGGRLACQDLFSHGQAARGPSLFFFFAAGSPAGVFSYRESLIGRARPARCRPNFKPAGLEISRSAKKNLDRAESSQGQRPGCRACFFRGPAKFPDSRV